MEENLKELFENLEDEGYVDIYFLHLPTQFDDGSEDFRKHRIKYNPNDDWEGFCRNRLEVEPQSIRLINDDKEIFIKGDHTGDSTGQERITYQVLFK